MISTDPFAYSYNPFFDDNSMTMNNLINNQPVREYLAYNPESDSLYFSHSTRHALNPSKAFDVFKRQYQTINLESLKKLQSLGTSSKKIYVKTMREEEHLALNNKSTSSLSRAFVKIFSVCILLKQSNAELVLKIQTLARNEIAYRSSISQDYYNLLEKISTLYTNGRFSSLSIEEALEDPNAMACKTEILHLIKIRLNDTNSMKSAKSMLQNTEPIKLLKSIGRTNVSFAREVNVQFI